MRGKLVEITPYVAGIGITPADAGKTAVAVDYNSTIGDHPRGCGENFPSGFGFSFPLGSPPRMRGKLYKAAEILGVERITPADAGKTVYRRSRAQAV